MCGIQKILSSRTISTRFRNESEWVRTCMEYEGKEETLFSLYFEYKKQIMNTFTLNESGNFCLNAG